jgi:uncharacterized protein (TIGR02996 family)
MTPYRVVCVGKANGLGPEGDGRSFVYVGRNIHHTDWKKHPLANPFRLKKGDTDEERAACIARYRAWLLTLPDLSEQLAELRTATRNGELPLGCWCAPRACHADVLAELLRAGTVGGAEAHRIVPEAAPWGRAVLTDGDALLAAVFADLNDDHVRLVYADWLQEHGEQERADFIRLQVEFAQKVAAEPKGLTSKELSDHQMVIHFSKSVKPVFAGGVAACACVPCLRTREIQLRFYRQKDRDGLAPGVPLEWHLYGPGQTIYDRPSARLVRGFVDHVACSAEEWERRAEGILARHPVRSVELTRPQEPDRLPLDLYRVQTTGGESLRSHHWPGIAFELSRPK